MNWHSSPRLFELLDRQRPMLDEIFGAGSYRIEDADARFCVLRTNDLEIEFAYDWRDESLSSSLRPLNTPPQTDIATPPELWVRFREKDLPARRRSALDDQQVIDELERIREVLRTIFADPQTLRDAAFFNQGYNRAYNDWASREGSWREDESS